MAETENKQQKVVIVGSGIAGLACAYYLQSLSKDLAVKPEVIVLERGLQAGGVISTGSYEGSVIEHGPDSVLTQKPWALDLFAELGLANEVVETNKEKRKTYVAEGSSLQPLPDGFVMLAPSQAASFLKSSLFSPLCKLRVALELFIPKRKSEEDESVADFICRRFGREILDTVVQPMVGGIYTGDLQQLSARSTIGRFVDLEQKYGSVIAGLRAEAAANKSAANESAGEQTAGARYSLFVSLSKGIGQLVEEICRKLPPSSIRFGSPVQSAVYDEENKNWQLRLATNEVILANYVVFACPAYEVAKIVGQSYPDLAAKLDKIPYASSAVVNLVYKQGDIPDKPNGFGFVVPITDKRSLLACSFVSEKFPNRAPAGMTVLRAFVGGVLQPEIYALSDGKILKRVCSDLDVYLDIKTTPTSYFLRRYPRSMPQYNVGHQKLVQSIFQMAAQLPCLSLCGSAYYGVGIPDCIHSGKKAAEEIAAKFCKDNPISCQ